MPIQNFTKIRRTAFKKPYILNESLIRLAKTEPNHDFLANPTVLLIYTYLVNYIKSVSDVYFERGETLKILDWGCGKGHITYLIKEIFPDKLIEVTSCDVSDVFAKEDSAFKQRTPILDYAKIDVVPLTHESRLPFSDEIYDIVISMGVLEHVPNDIASLHEINRVMKNDGLFFCFHLPYTYSWTQKLAHMKGDYYHDRFYNHTNIKELLKISNFNIVDIWHRALFPKNTIRYPKFTFFEYVDQIVCEVTPLRFLATNIEFLATKVRN